MYLNCHNEYLKMAHIMIPFILLLLYFYFYLYNNMQEMYNQIFFASPQMQMKLIKELKTNSFNLIYYTSNFSKSSQQFTNFTETYYFKELFNKLFYFYIFCSFYVNFINCFFVFFCLRSIFSSVSLKSNKSSLIIL